MVISVQGAFTCLHLQMIRMWTFIVYIIWIITAGPMWHQSCEHVADTGQRNIDEMIGAEPFICSKNTAGIRPMLKNK